jgi:hypothetical protein
MSRSGVSTFRSRKVKSFSAVPVSQKFFKLVRNIHSLGGSSEDTIFALATPVGRGAIAVIRISGTSASKILQSYTMEKPLPSPRQATLRILVDPRTNDPLDTAVVIWFPGPASYTGEDTVEMHIHGGIAVVDDVLASLASQPSLRLATPGEFTRRALLNGKLDLVEAEGLADLLLVGVMPHVPYQLFALLMSAYCRRKLRHSVAQRFGRWSSARPHLLHAAAPPFGACAAFVGAAGGSRH